MTTAASASPRQFIGAGPVADAGPWLRNDGEAEHDASHPEHPAGYIAMGDLVEAVNTALILTKPLLLTGRPGTGKSDLAERIAWEFGLGPVLRFEAQSLSEAQDLFYRFDLVGQMAAAQLARSGHSPRLPGKPGEEPGMSAEAAVAAERFLSFGPLGKAILRAAPKDNLDLLRLAFPDHITGQALEPHTSVVLIDEIDKAARDFPNDLLNGIQRLEFRIRELHDRLVKVPRDDSLRPIVIITSNVERDLPEPFLRRCAYFHIPDPDPEQLRRILRNRVFPDRPATGEAAGAAALPPFYEALLAFFVDYRERNEHQLAYRPGTSELLDWARALRHHGADETADLEDNLEPLRRTRSVIVKHREDIALLAGAFKARGLQMS